MATGKDRAKGAKIYEQLGCLLYLHCNYDLCGRVFATLLRKITLLDLVLLVDFKYILLVLIIYA